MIRAINKKTKEIRQGEFTLDINEIEIPNDNRPYSIIDGKLIDFSKTEEYKKKTVQLKISAEKLNLQLQIYEIDKKRIRAICEPSAKDETTGQTWLEYYNLQVQELRNQINALS